MAARRHRRWATVASAVAFTATALAGGASAQLGDIGEQTVDTPYTPVAKPPPEKSFTQVAGARWSKEGPQPEQIPADSPTPFEVDFFAVSFYDPDRGFAAGTVE